MNTEQDREALTADARREAGKWGPGPTATGLLLHRLADVIEALVKERDELAAVIEKMHSAGDRLINSRGDEWVEIDAPEWDQILSTTPADALREHDAALIESLADEAEAERERIAESTPDPFTGLGRERSQNLGGQRELQRRTSWLRERARQVREGEA